MQPEHRIGQLMMIGLPGPQFDNETKELITTIQPGGVLLAGRNVESAQQVVELTSSIRNALQVPPIIAVDQEGGRVDRLKEIYSPMPSADLLRNAADASLAARMGEITAEALRTLGFNVNLAPVLDIAIDDSAENGIKGRYLGDSVAEVIRLAGAYLEGIQHGGIVGIGKHFPGLGPTSIDSHSELPRVDSPKDELLRQGAAPYIELFSKINARLNAVLVGHGHYPAFDGPSPLPASLSKNIVTGFLREELSFRGLVITDDLDMGAITATRSINEAAITAIEAGNDMVMITGSTENIIGVWQSVVEVHKAGRITKSHISRSFDHIARVKSMVSSPHPLTDIAVSRLRERIAELNLVLQHSK
jgi:beta-N-acetylhexosaminidase